jgi:hypothetical protein
MGYQPMVPVLRQSPQAKGTSAPILTAENRYAPA